MQVKIENNFLRGELLSFLHTVYPDGIPELMIIETFYEYNETSAIQSALAYLCEKEYAEKKETKHLFQKNKKFRWYKITAKGIDLLEENISKDVGIIFQ